MNKPQAPAGNLFVTVNRRFNDEISTESGIKLFKDTTFHPEWNTCIEGVVHSVPMRVGAELGNKGMQPTVREGDTVFFEYHILLDRRNSYLFEGKEYWIVPYGCLFARVLPDGELDPVSGKAIVEPEVIEEKIQTTLIIPESVKSSMNKPKRDRGILRYCGVPNRGQEELGVPAGNRVYFPEFCAHLNTLNGKEYYIMNQEYILAHEPV